jgi:hypothetical protein
MRLLYAQLIALYRARRFAHSLVALRRTHRFTHSLVALFTARPVASCITSYSLHNAFLSTSLVAFRAGFAHNFSLRLQSNVLRLRSLLADLIRHITTRKELVQSLLYRSSFLARLLTS